jgi:hypothetical protein
MARARARRVLVSVAALLGTWAVALVVAALIARHVLARRDEKAAAHDPRRPFRRD